MAWGVDYDYAHRLPPEERTWLGQFTDRFYGADFRGPSEGEWSDAARRAQYRAKNAANRDIYAHAEGHAPEDLEEHAVNDETPIEPKRRGRPRKHPAEGLEAGGKPEVDEDARAIAGVGAVRGPGREVDEDARAIEGIGAVRGPGRSAGPTNEHGSPTPVEWLSLHKTPRGFVVLVAKSLGRELVEEDVLHGPMPHASARNFLRLEIERRFLRRPR